MTFSTLRELHALIGTAIDDIERVYLQASPPSFPPLYSQSPPSPLSPRSPSPSPCSSPSYYSPGSDYSEEDAHNGDISTLPTPVSVKFAISSPPKKKSRGRSRAYTLPPLSPSESQDITPPWAHPKPILRMPPEPPLEFPDLNAPYFPSPAPTDPGQGNEKRVRSLQERAEQRNRDRQTKSEDLTTNIDVTNSVNKIVAACAQLSVSVQKPFLTLCDAAMGYHLPSCLRFLEEAHIVEILRDAGPGGLHVKDISERIVTLTFKSTPPGVKRRDLDPAKLSHILRLLATHHITREIRPDVFTNNRVSSLMDTGKRVEDLFEAPDVKYEGTNGISAFVGLCVDECFKASAYLTDCYLPSKAPLLPSTNQLSTPPSSSPMLSATHSPMTFSSNSPSDRMDEPATPKQTQSLRKGLGAYNQRTPTTPLSPSETLVSSAGGQNRGLAHKLSMSMLRSSQASFSSPPLHLTTPTSSPVSTKSPGLLKRMGSKPLLGPAFSFSGMKDAGSKMGKKVSVGSFASSDARNGGNHGDDESEVSGTTLGTPVQVLSPARANFLATSPTASRRPSLASLHAPPTPSLLPPPPVPPLPANFGHSSSSLDLLSTSPPGTGTINKISNKPHRTSSKSSLLSAFGSVPPSPTAASSPVTKHSHHRHTSSLSPISDASSPIRSATTRKSPPPLYSSSSTPSATATSAPPQTRITVSHPMHAPFNLAFQTDKPYFEWLEGEGNVGRLKRFGKAMTGTGGWEGGAVVDCLPWGDLPAGSFVVDVGGGIGSTAMLLASAFKHLRFVVQDRAPVVEMGIKAWKARCPEMLEDGTATFQAHDFFTPQPPLPEPKPRSPPSSLEHACGNDILGSGAPSPEPRLGSPGDGFITIDKSTCVFPSSPPQSPLPKATEPPIASVFLLRVITHDWPDAFVTRILLHLRRAAGPGTMLLLADYILPLACVDEDAVAATDGGESREVLPGHVKTLAPEGSSILPNFGKANANAYWLDLTMRVMFNAQERTLREMTALTLTAGWKVVRVTRAEGTLFGHVIAVPVEIPSESLRLLEPNSIDGEGTFVTGGGAGDRVAQNELCNPTMGDTFFSRVDLPSEDAIIRSTMRLNRSRKKSSGFGLSLSGLGFGKKRRDRAHTITASASGTLPTSIPHQGLVSTPIATSISASMVPPLDNRPVNPTSLGGERVTDYDGTGHTVGKKEAKKGWRSLVRMLSKPQLNSPGGSNAERDRDEAEPYSSGWTR